MKYLSYKLFVRALSNRTRFELIRALRKGPKSVKTLVRTTGFEQSRVSHNLRCLVECGFVENTRRGKEVVYSLNVETIIPLLKLIDRHIERYSRHLVKCGVIEAR